MHFCQVSAPGNDCSPIANVPKKHTKLSDSTVRRISLETCPLRNSQTMYSTDRCLTPSRFICVPCVLSVSGEFPGTQSRRRLQLLTVYPVSHLLGAKPAPKRIDGTQTGKLFFVFMRLASNRERAFTSMS